MTEKYIDSYHGISPDRIYYSSVCTKCNSRKWKSASLIYQEESNKLAKACAPPSPPKKPHKPLPKLIRISLGIILAVVFFILGTSLLKKIRHVSDYLGISPDSLLITPFVIIYGGILLIVFYGLIRATLEISFSKSNYENDLERYNKFHLPRFNQKEKLYDQLRVCMRCGHHYLGK